MPIRVLAALLAILMAAGVASPVLAAAPDAVSQIDDGAPDLVPVMLSAEVAVELPVLRALPLIAPPPASSAGRLHAAWVFRPPRLFASR